MAVQTSRPVPGAGPGQGHSQQLSSRRLPGWLVVAVPVIAELLIGGYRIAGPSLWRDEAATISGSNRSVTAILALTQHQDAVHGLYYLLIHAVIAVGGTSETALRLPSLIAMALAAGLLAELGRRVARNTGLPSPGAIGVLSGLLLAVIPLTTRYAQEARPYALTTLFAVTASYLLVRAVADHRWPWWAGYAAAITVTALLNLFAVLLVVAHGLTLLAARSKSPVPAPSATTTPIAAPASASTLAPVADVGLAADPDGIRPSGHLLTPGVLTRWLVACGAVAVLLAPIVVLSVGQSAQLNWVTRPDPSTVATLVRDFSGITALIPVIAVLGLFGCVAGPGLRRGGGLTLALLALPWLIAPPILLLAVSLADPLYVERYVMFCLPALSLLAAVGLIWLVELTRRAILQRVLTPGEAGTAVAEPGSALGANGLAFGQRGGATAESGGASGASGPMIGESGREDTRLGADVHGPAVGDRSREPGRARAFAFKRVRVLAVTPSLVLALVVLAALIGPQRAIRQPSARADNLRAVTATVAANEHPGDAILYLPWDTALVGMAYPAPFAKLADSGQASSPIASATLRGLPATPTVVTARLRTVPRLWTVQWIPPIPTTAQEARALAASGFHVIHRWKIQSVLLTLYAR